MKTRTVIERIGENMGPIDWSYDFRSHFNNHCLSDEGRDEECRKHVERLREIVAGIERGEYWVAECYGVQNPIIDVGMYDGWPYWKPTPSIALRSWLGVEWHPFHSIKWAGMRIN